MSEGYVKVCILGQSNVGKTCLLNRYFKGTFDHITCTTASDVFSKIVDRNGTEFELRVVDTAGQEKFRSLSNLYLRNSQAAIFAFDLSQPGTIDELDYYEKELNNANRGQMIKYIVGTKSDLLNADKIDSVMNRARNKFNDIDSDCFFETSSQNGDGVEELFTFIINDKRIALPTATMETNVVKDLDSQGKASRCC